MDHESANIIILYYCNSIWGCELGALFGGAKPTKSPALRRECFPTAAAASLNMHIVSTNFAKMLVCKREYEVIF